MRYLAVLASLLSISALASDTTAQKPPAPVMIELGDIDQNTATQFIAEMKLLKSQNQQHLYIRINSTGGAIVWGERVAQTIEGLGIPVTCYVDTKALSMAFYVLQSCTERMMTRRSVLMAHQPAGEVQGQPTNADNFRAYLLAIEEATSEHISHRLKISKDQYLKKIAGGREWYLTWKQALAVGAVDAVLPNDFSFPPLEEIDNPAMIISTLGG